MYKFNTVRALSKSNLIEAIQQYAREEVLAKKTNSIIENKDVKLEKINKAFVRELESQVGKEIPTTSKQEMKRYSISTDVQENFRYLRDIMVDAVLPIVASASTLNTLMDVRYADYGDSIKFTVENKALYTVTKASFKKRHAEVQKAYRTDVILSGENHKVTVMADLFDIMQGTVYIGLEVMKTAVSIEHALFADGYTSLQSALTGSNIPSELTASGFSDSAFLTLKQKVQAYNGGGKVVAVGTELALSSILPSGQSLVRLMEDGDYVKNGFFSTYKGVELVPLEQVVDVDNQATYGTLFNDKQIYLVSVDSDKLIKAGIFGGTFSHENHGEDNANKESLHTIEESWEVAVVSPSICGLITLP